MSLQKSPQRFELFWPKVEVWGNGCWYWTGSKVDGYGYFGGGDRVYLAHRWLYQQLVRSLRKSEELDHLCRNRSCVCPDHVQPVVHQTNMSRSGALGRWRSGQTHCKRGHELTPENTYSPPSRPNSRHCRTCIRLHESRRTRAQ